MHHDNAQPRKADHDVLAHERLDCYRLAVERLELGEQLTRRLPRTKGQLGDQLARASEGLALCIAESAAAEHKSAEQRRYFRAARGCSDGGRRHGRSGCSRARPGASRSSCRRRVKSRPAA